MPSPQIECDPMDHTKFVEAVLGGAVLGEGDVNWLIAVM